MAVGATVALDADGAYVDHQHDRELPDLVVEPGEGRSSRAIPSASPNVASRSTAMSPTIRIARPGPGWGDLNDLTRQPELYPDPSSSPSSSTAALPV